MLKERLIRDLISGGLMFTVTFEKDNGEERTINGRRGVIRYLTGNGRRNTDESLINLYSIRDKGYRNFRINKVKSIAAKGLVVNFKE